MRSENYHDDSSVSVPSRAPGSLPLHREILFIGTACMVQVLTQGGFGQTLSIAYIIGQSFGMENQPGELSWFTSAYGLTMGTFILVAGRLGDMFGYKKMVVFGFLWLGTWSLVCGLAVFWGHGLFVVARAFQGTGSAILLPNTIALLGSSYPPGPRKNLFFTLFGAAAPAGGVIGAAFAALFGQLLWWPWAFFTLAIACTFLAVLSLISIPPVLKSNHRQSFDFWGAMTGVIGLVCINVAWNQAPIVGWSEIYVYVLLIIGFLFLVAFALVELYHASFPLLPFNILSVNVALVLICVACGWGSFGIWIYYTYQFLLTFRNVTPLLGAAQCCPPGVLGLGIALTTSYLLSRMRPDYVITISMAAFTIGMIVTMTVPVHQTYWGQIFLGMIIVPWGVDMSFSAGSIIISGLVSREHQGIAGSLISTVANYSMSLGLGFAGTAASQVNGKGNASDQGLQGFRAAWYVGCGLAGLGLAFSIAKMILDRRRSMSG
jgi:MFS family permease